MTDGERIAKLEARFDSQDKEIDALRNDVKLILAYVSSAKGSWRMLTVVCGVVASLGAGIATLIGLLRH